MDRADKLRGLYENKIRFFCGPEKVFEIFATDRGENGKLKMTYVDFYKAVTPFTYCSVHNTKEYFEKFKPELLTMIDADDSGLIEFTEFFFFILLLQVPMSTVRKQFKKHTDGKMNAEEFSKMLRKLRHRTATGQKQVDTVALDSRQVSATDEEFFDKQATYREDFPEKGYLTHNL